MKFPIFVVDQNDVDIFNSKEALSRYVEPYDIDESEAFDADGMALNLSINNSVVVVTENSDSICRPSILEDALRKYLKAVDPGLNTENLELDDLVSVSIEKIGFS